MWPLSLFCWYSAATGLAYGRFYSTIGMGNRLEKTMLKTDIIHQLDRCGLSLDDVKMDYNMGFTPLGAYGSSCVPNLFVPQHAPVYKTFYIPCFTYLGP